MTDKTEYIGKRVRFLRSSDPYTKLVYGDEGVVMSVDDLGTVHVAWDNGSTLGMITEEGDRFQLIRETK
jgi:hypothetical protein